MVHVFRGVENLKRHGLAEEMWRVRYDTFIEELKWPLPSRNKQERDCYDDDGATYLVSFDESNRIKASARLIPTTTPFLMEEIFPHLVESPRDLPRGPTTIEFTRYFIRSDLMRSRGVIRTAGEIFCSIFEYCLNEGIDTMLAVVDTKILPQAYEMGWQPTPLGIPGDFGGGPNALGGGTAVAIKVDINESALRSTAHARRVSLPTLTHGENVPAPRPISPAITLN
jgi:acyl-homoserine lactone synthase